MLRVFFAVEFDHVIKEYLWEKQQTIRKESVKGNFTDLENFHLTLRFIGEVEQKQLPQLKGAVDKVTGGLKQFSLTLRGIGQFPRGEKKIIWIGLDPSQQLQELYYRLEDDLAAQGYPREDRPYRPHITLGREVVLTDDFKYIQEKLQLQPCNAVIARISLMESTRINGKLMYIPVYSKQLVE